MVLQVLRILGTLQHLLNLAFDVFPQMPLRLLGEVKACERPTFLWEVDTRLPAIGSYSPGIKCDVAEGGLQHLLNTVDEGSWVC